jgi:hypothetical protein
MLFISIEIIDAKVSSKQKNIVYTTIIDYSKKGHRPEENALFWKEKDETSWETIP